MADIRIKDLATLESASLTGDVFVIDGTTGTRKLSAFSPSFGGNATVTGTLTVNGSTLTSAGSLLVNGATSAALFSGQATVAIKGGSGGAAIYLSDATGSTPGATSPTLHFASSTDGISLRASSGVFQVIDETQPGAGDGSLRLSVTNAGVVSIPATTASTTTSSGALVVSGGVGVAGALYAANLGGTSTNNNAASGCIGEYTSATTAYASKVSLTSNTAANIVSISLTAGDWDVQFNPVFTQDTPLTTSGLLAGVSSSSATLPSGAAERAHSPSGPNGNSDISIAPPVTRISLASTTTIYGVATGIFSAGTMSAYGFIRARRVR